MQRGWALAALSHSTTCRKQEPGCTAQTSKHTQLWSNQGAVKCTTGKHRTEEQFLLPRYSPACSLVLLVMCRDKQAHKKLLCGLSVF